jgi:hypothetical protein
MAAPAACVEGESRCGRDATALQDVFAVWPSKTAKPPSIVLGATIK